jgi:hypothetical protein
MSTSDPPLDPKDVLSELPLGASTGDDRHLQNRLEPLADQINDDASPRWRKTIHDRLRDLLCFAKSFLPKAATWTSRTVRLAVERFTRIEIERIKAEAEAAAIKAKAESEAAVKRAEADVILADANTKLEQGKAIAEEMRAQTRRRDVLLALMLKRGIAFEAEYDEDGAVRIVFTKKIAPRKNFYVGHLQTNPELSEMFELMTSHEDGSPPSPPEAPHS